MLHAYQKQDIQSEGFDYIFDAVIALDNSTAGLSDFHVLFLLQLSRYLGFYPSQNYTPQRCFFNLSEGVYQSHFDHTPQCMEKEESYSFFMLSELSPGQKSTYRLSVVMKKKLLYRVIEYYRYHIEGFQEPKSLHTLEMVFQ